MHKIVVLWATPRTTSTAFEWMMRMRGDMICFHEPFGEAWYKGDDARFPRLAADSPRIPGLTRQVVLERLRRGDLFMPLIDAIARGGRYTCAGAIVAFDLRTFYLRDLTFTGATVVPPGVFADLVGYIERGEIRPLLAETHPLSDLRKAQEAFIAKRHVGNIVVLP